MRLDVSPRLPAFDHADRGSIDIELASNGLTRLSGSQKPFDRHYVIAKQSRHGMTFPASDAGIMETMPAEAIARSALGISVVRVLRPGPDPQMARIAASTVRDGSGSTSCIARVADLHSVRDLPVNEEVGDVVSCSVAVGSCVTFGAADNTVPPAVLSAFPKPAVVGSLDINVRPETVDESLSEVVPEIDFHIGYFIDRSSDVNHR